MTTEPKSIDHNSELADDVATSVPPAVIPAAVPIGPSTAPITLVRTALAGAGVGAIALAGVMAIQSVRHGWPFSLHHRDGQVAGKVQRVPAPPSSASQAPESQPRAAVTLASSRAAEFGVRTEAVRSEATARTIRAVATVVPDESRVSEIHTRVSGWIEQLYVNETGQSVRAGQSLAAIFSPDLMAAQNELFALKKSPVSVGPSPMLDGARSRLSVLGMSDGQIAALEAQGKPMRLVSVASPRKGVVIRRNVAVGTAIDPSTELMTILDLSVVWVLAEVSERDVPDVPRGTPAALEFPASGVTTREAKVAFIYPTLTERTRTLRVRFELDNPNDQLKPGMYGSATFETAGRHALTVARDAIVDTGLEQHVFVVDGPEHYLPRRVEVGVELGDRVEIRSGLAVNELVVASGVFLIDSESRLRASGGGAMAGMKMDSKSGGSPMSSSSTNSPANQQRMPGMQMDPAKVEPGASPRPTASGRAQRETAPMPMPMPMPSDSASSTHSGHKE